MQQLQRHLSFSWRAGAVVHNDCLDLVYLVPPSRILAALILRSPPSRPLIACSALPVCVFPINSNAHVSQGSMEPRSIVVQVTSLQHFVCGHNPRLYCFGMFGNEVIKKKKKKMHIKTTSVSLFGLTAHWFIYIHLRCTSSWSTGYIS